MFYTLQLYTLHYLVSITRSMLYHQTTKHNGINTLSTHMQDDIHAHHADVALRFCLFLHYSYDKQQKVQQETATELTTERTSFKINFNCERLMCVSYVCRSVTILQQKNANIPPSCFTVINHRNGRKLNVQDF